MSVLIKHTDINVVLINMFFILFSICMFGLIFVIKDRLFVLTCPLKRICHVKFHACFLFFSSSCAFKLFVKHP